VRGAATTALLGAGFVVAAGLLDAEPFYVPGVAFLLVGVLCAAWVATAARGVRLSRAVGARRVVEDEPLEARVLVRAGALPFPAGTVEEPLLDDPVPLPTGRQRFGFRVQARFARRGRRALAPPRVVVRDPLGLAVREAAVGEQDDVLVLPRTEPVVATGAGPDGARAGDRPLLAEAAETEIDGLRAYREGTPATRIHWPALARRRGLLERRLQAEADSRPLVALDARATDEADLDAAVRAAASLALALAAEGGCSVLLPGDRRPTDLGAGLGGWPDLHARLALVTAVTSPPALSAAGARAGPVVYVAARRLHAAPHGLGRVPHGSVLVLPGSATTLGPEQFAVSGCRGYALGTARPRAAGRRTAAA
jgi:uncharacterized protein (DUF58 family)